MPRLDFYLNYELQATFKLEAEEVFVGRDPSCAICMPDDMVSRRHAVIRARGDGHEIENRGRNGTKVNGRLLDAPHVLAPGDAIFISRYVLIYQPDDAPQVSVEQTMLAD